LNNGCLEGVQDVFRRPESGVRGHIQLLVRVALQDERSDLGNTGEELTA